MGSLSDEDRHVPDTRLFLVAVFDNVDFTQEEYDHLKNCPTCLQRWKQYLDDRGGRDDRSKRGGGIMTTNEKRDYIRKYGDNLAKDAIENNPFSVETMYWVLRQQRMFSRLAAAYLKSVKRKTISSRSQALIRRMESTFSEYILPIVADRTIDEIGFGRDVDAALQANGTDEDTRNEVARIIQDILRENRHLIPSYFD